MIDYVGLVEETNQVVFLSSSELLEEGREERDDLEEGGGALRVTKHLLKKRNKIIMHSNLVDAHFYVFDHWVLDILEENDHISSIKADLIPYLVKRQFCGEDSKCQEQQLLALKMSSMGTKSTEYVRCFACILSNTGGYCARANTIASYSAINFDLVTRPVSAHTPWDIPLGISTRFKECLVGEGINFGDKVSLKLCIVGKNCKIGNRTKLNRCIVMDNVTIGEGCVIQNSIICSDAKVMDRCNINDCEVAHATKVAEGSKFKNESLEGMML